MNKFCIFVGMTILSSVGWWLGEFIGPFSALFLSGVGGMAGVYLGWRVCRDYLE